MTQIKEPGRPLGFPKKMHPWQPVATAPFDRDLELAVIDRDGEHVLVFACRRIAGGWINARTRQWISVLPTHWREWREDEPKPSL